MKIMDLFKGLSKEYYFRQLFFGFLMFSAMVFLINQGKGIDKQFGLIVFWLISTFLYPYARFAYESIVEFFVGNNVFFTNAIFFMIVKVLTMFLCWGFAIFIAPIGLLFIYLHQRKEQQKINN
ncbi:MAG: hypothetical protein JXA94_03870 [Parachlamydiales bacterium]|nr:hypothetical protein [Parachlamydiales bacterium]